MVITHILSEWLSTVKLSHISILPTFSSKSASLLNGKGIPFSICRFLGLMVRDIVIGRFYLPQSTQRRGRHKQVSPPCHLRYESLNDYSFLELLANVSNQAFIVNVEMSARIQDKDMVYMGFWVLILLLPALVALRLMFRIEQNTRFKSYG